MRDFIWNKKINDLDFKVHLPVSEMIRILEGNGYKRSPDYHTKEHEYYVSGFSGVVGAVIDGVDVHLTEVDTVDIPTLISIGDINFSCCVFNANTGKIENPDIIREIKDRELKFCNPESAKADPIIVINALKQISRIPDIKIPEETRKIILDSVPKIVEFSRTNSQFRYKLASLCGNLNSEEVYAFFGDEAETVFEGMDKKKPKLVASPHYTSVKIDELLESDREEIMRVLKGGFGKHFDAAKAFAPNVNSVVFERREGKIRSCCLVDGDRMYAVAARDGADWIAIIADLVKNNYNVWGTVDCNNPKMQALCSIGGLSIENNPETIRKILTTKSDKYKDVEIYELNGLVVFKKKNKPDDYPQVLLRS